jgi:proteasome alpha subunit
MQVYTQYGGIRPFGVSLLIGGVDEGGAKLFEAEPSGAMTAYKADSIGANKKEVDEILEDKYSERMSLDDAIGVCIDALRETQEEKLIPENMEISYVPTKTGKCSVLTDKQVSKYLTPPKAGK